MERLFFVCPTTRQRVDAGIESEIGTLLQVRDKKVSVVCPHCGQTHSWLVGEGQLVRTTGAEGGDEHAPSA